MMASQILVSIGSTTSLMLNGPNSRFATFIRASGVDLPIAFWR